jgi:hypothetical protein
MGTKFTQVDVTQTDIDKADPKKSGRCAVSTAIARVFPDATRIETDIQTVRFTRNGERFQYVTPYTVAGYVVAFDRGDDIHPFTFRLNETARVGAKRRPRTPAGKAVTNATTKVKRREAQAKQLDMIAKDPTAHPTLPPPSPAARKVAKERVTDAKADLASITAAYEGQQKRTTSGGERKAAPRVFRTGRREYGHRVLAVNQEQ